MKYVVCKNCNWHNSFSDNEEPIECSGCGTKFKLMEKEKPKTEWTCFYCERKFLTELSEDEKSRGIFVRRCTHCNKETSHTLDQKRTFATGAQRTPSLDMLRYDLINCVMVKALAEIMTEGVPKYGERNYEKGIPYSEMYNHLMSHLMAWRRGDTSEPHLKKVLWGIAVLVYYEAKFGVDNELNDMKDVVW